MSTNVAGSNNPIDTDAQSEKVTAALALAEDRDDELTTLLVEIIQEQSAQLEAQGSLVEALRTQLADYRAENEKDKAEIRRFAKEKAEEAGTADADGGGERTVKLPHKTMIRPAISGKHHWSGYSLIHRIRRFALPSQSVVPSRLLATSKSGANGFKANTRSTRA